MRSMMRLGILLSVALGQSCATRQSDGSDTRGTNGVVQLPPFNAYFLWRDGNKKLDGTNVEPIYDYPRGYDEVKGKIDPDGVFYVAQGTYRNYEEFFGTTTEGAKVEGDVLTYPVRDGRSLVLKFSALADDDMYHLDAVEHCKKLGLRLPHVQEILDYCAAGTKKGLEGSYENHRCDKSRVWSGSVDSGQRRNAWHFAGLYGDVNMYDRLDYRSGVRCVGTP